VEANLSRVADQVARDRLTGIIAGVGALEAQAAQLIATVRARYA
jgi:hypothetical protein